MNNNTSIRLIR